MDRDNRDPGRIEAHFKVAGDTARHGPKAVEDLAAGLDDQHGRSVDESLACPIVALAFTCPAPGVSIFRFASGTALPFCSTLMTVPASSVSDAIETASGVDRPTYFSGEWMVMVGPSSLAGHVPHAARRRDGDQDDGEEEELEELSPLRSYRAN